MKRLSTPILLGIALVFLLISSSVYTVYQTDKVLIVRLGKVVTDASGKDKIMLPGLHVKLPFVDTALFFDTRLNLSDIDSARIVTREKKDLIVDLFVEWRISDYGQFYRSTNGAGDSRARAQELLHQKVIDILRSEFGQRTIKDLVSGERIELMEKLRRATGDNVAGLGMELVDVRIRRMDLPQEVSDAVFDRMRSERKRVATELRANGESKAEIIRAEAERKRRVLLAEAEKEAEILRGEGDALATQLYSDSYNQAPEFYKFYKSLDVYVNSFKSEKDILLLKSDSEFFKYFRNFPE